MDILSFKRGHSETTSPNRSPITEKRKKSDAEEITNLPVEKQNVLGTEMTKTDFLEALDKAILIKEEGNAFFRNGEYKEAVLKYYEAIDYVVNHASKQIGLEEYEKFKLSIITNLVMCFYKSGDYSATQLQCEEGFKLYPENIKLKFYYGLALAKQQNYNRAIQALNEALRLDPSNSEISSTIHLLQQEMRSTHQEMQGIFSQKEKLRSYKKYWILGGIITTTAIAGLYLYKRRRSN